MVKRLLSFINKETAGLHAGAYLLGFFAILSQVLAFLRDRLLAHLFGASETLDIYYAAFRIPDFIFVTIASVVSLSVLVPFIVEHEERGREAVRDFIDNIFTFFSILVVITAIIAFFFVPSLTSLLFRGLSPEAQSQVVFISRILLISPIALGFSNLLGSITQAYNRFAVYALAPLLYNVGIIFGIIVFGRTLGAVGVALGVIIGAILHVLVQVPFTYKMGLIPRLKRHINFEKIKVVATLSVPRTLTLSANHIALLFLVAIASLMTQGSISVLSLSLNIQSVPLAIIGVSYSLAAFPTLSRYFAQKNMKAFLVQMSTTTRHIIFWSLPFTALFVILRAQIVRVLLGTGAFDWNDTRLTAAALALFVISSVFQSLTLLFMRAFYSIGLTKKPFVLSMISTLFLVASSYGLVNWFYASEGLRHFIEVLLRVEGLPGTVVLMLPLGFSLGITLNALALWIGFEKEFRGFSTGIFATFLQSFTAATVMGIVSYWGLVVFANLLDTTTLVGIFLQGLASGLFGIAAGILILYLLKSRELIEVWRAVHNKFWKAKVIATDPEIV
jgi:putative peptidoglycan lipid II flippase